MAERTLPARAVKRSRLLERIDEFRREYLWAYIFIAPLLLLVGVCAAFGFLLGWFVGGEAVDFLKSVFWWS